MNNSPLAKDPIYPAGTTAKATWPNPCDWGSKQDTGWRTRLVRRGQC